MKRRHYKDFSLLQVGCLCSRRKNVAGCQNSWPERFNQSISGWDWPLFVFLMASFILELKLMQNVISGPKTSDSGTSSSNHWVKSRASSSNHWVKSRASSSNHWAKNRPISSNNLLKSSGNSLNPWVKIEPSFSNNWVKSIENSSVHRLKHKSTEWKVKQVLHYAMEFFFKLPTYVGNSDANAKGSGPNYKRKMQ
jgi:hypothetical protein